MRLLRLLTQRYTLPQTLVIAVPSLVLSIAVRVTAIALRVPEAAGVAASLTVLFASYIAIVAVIDRRARG